MLHTIFQITLLCVSLSMLGLVYRVVKGPTTPDRVVALDAIGINLIAIIALVSMMLDTYAFLEVILLLGILAFLGTVAFSKFLEKGEIIERERDH
ncbi:MULTISPECIES: Na(+)/H(+) antiporter subunit F1 [Bacillaceae]|jgi:multicomponent Na+:H+ antiporter subunit F|uniref:Multisubunit sodium/proton antiporter MrpF subunit n=1 Tax=Rossellomorea aquimaris TaxID=189382 RepID=A0A366ESX6_9BACI|nr:MULTISPECIES: Na(+)/H(+) antiporter subunit F1 [Bacillaceae]KAA0561165.1 Na(+)/H(+) antiporter subunit F1 [Bacillus sp. CH30_1T]MDT9026175.1 Na(+)/H(+) antiporter subunit F1 [Rossellomorea sp. YC4-1]RBP05404.1 multisubunit sodium/proton antiporter MrpF subunit [Rossellomorea aquimaris]TYS75900.1 Na(+)/H(+) antiporter subunit F1 [Rossellomorea aquimaris]TYS81161.1 Na(+)/H(+) antiporter subunit F1 [Rossellomorea aquimaris]